MSADIQEKIKRAEQARARATDRLARLKTAARAADRRADAHRKIELGGLIIAAGCDAWDPAEIVGALVDVRTQIASSDQMRQWREQGINTLEARKIARQRGLSLLSVMVAVALGAGLLAVGWTVATHARRTADVQAASQQAVTLSKRVAGAWAASSDFVTLSNTSAAARGVFQRSDLDAGGNPVDPWGGAVTLSPLGDGYSLIFAAVPPASCPQLVAATAAGFTSVSVQVGTAWQAVAQHGKADMAAASLACEQAGDQVAVQFGAGKVGAAFPITPLTPCSAPPPSYNPPSSGTGTCPAGQVTASGGTTWGTTSPVSPTTYACMGPYGSPLATPGTATGPWTPTAATMCAPQCMAPAPVTPPPTTGTGTCPAGQVTASGASTFPTTTTWTPTTSVCAGPWGPVTTTPGTSSTSPSAASVCAPACVAPPPSTTTQGGPPQTAAGTPIVTTRACPAGQTGTITTTQPTTTTRTTTETRTTTYACPSPTGSAVATPGPWSAPGAPYGPWSAPAPAGSPTVSNTCTPTPPPPPTWSVSTQQMCVHPVNPIGGMGGGGACNPGGSTESWTSSGGVDCTYSVTIAYGGSSGSVVVDNPLAVGVGPYTRTGTVTVAGHAFTVSVTTDASAPTGTCAGSVSY